MRAAAADLGLSDNGLRKIVMKTNLPIPAQGHWNKIAAGKPVKPKPALPPRGFGASDEVRIGGDRWGYYDPVRLSDPVPKPPVFDELLESVRARAVKAVGTVTVPRDLRYAHPAVRRIVDDERLRAEKVRSSDWTMAWEKPRFDNPLDQRRLRLINAIATGIARTEVKTTLWGKENLVFSVGNDGTSMYLVVKKLVERGKDADTDKRLLISVGDDAEMKRSVRHTWQDADDSRLEGLMTDICVDLVVGIEDRYRQQKIDSHALELRQRAEMQEAARLAKIEAERRERERIAKLEQARIDRLLAEAARLRQATDIRAYVAAVEEMVRATGGDMVPGELDAWKSWALAQADRIDPVLTRDFLKRDEES